MNTELLAQLRAMDEEALYTALYTDILTGVQNRRAFESVEHVYLAIVDLDSLKYINDTVGHREGDAQLTRLARSLAALFGINNTYRIAGDEFVISGRGFAELRRGLTNLRRMYDRFSFGIGANLVAADNGLVLDKKRRELSGERAARGECPPWWTEETMGDQHSAS